MDPTVLPPVSTRAARTLCKTILIPEILSYSASGIDGAKIARNAS
jgi:hypothetical protein